MISDLVCYGIAAVSGGWPMRCRLNDLRNGFFWYLFQFLAYIGGFAIGISLVAERISYIVMMVGQGFRWDKADSTYYAFARVVYTGGMLFLMVLVWVCNIRLYFMYLMRRRNPDFIDRCGKVSMASYLSFWMFLTYRSCQPYGHLSFARYSHFDSRRLSFLPFIFDSKKDHRTRILSSHE